MARWKTLLAIAALFVIGAPLAAVHAGSQGWSRHRDPGVGFRFSYPSQLFAPIPGDGKPYFHYFVSPDDTAKFLVGAWNNGKRQTPESLKRWLMANAGGYEDVTYRPRGRNWFVLSGYRGDRIYYEKVIFSCGGAAVNVFAIAYPVEARELYDPVVERMEDDFRPGRGCAQ